MRFLVYPDKLLDAWPEAEHAYLSGPEDRVYPTQVEIDGPLLICRRPSSESGKLQVAWPLAGSRTTVIGTSTLPEREQPYVLAVELARGKIAQLRDQAAQWELAGMEITGDFQSAHKDAYALFTRALGLQDRPAEASEVAARAIDKAIDAADLLARSYCRQRLDVRRRQSTQLPASLGCHLGGLSLDDSEADAFSQSFNAAGVAAEWRRIEPVEGDYRWETIDRQVEMCAGRRLWMLGGPLLDLSPGGLPQWLSPWKDDFPNLLSFVCDFVETAVARYSGRIRAWEVCARMNTGGALALSEEHRIMLAARAIEVANRVDAESLLLVRVDRPWGEYQARGRHRLSPFQFVDALLRSGVGLEGVNLEIAVGGPPRGLQSRDALEFSRLLDLWSCLGAPIYVTLAIPSADGAEMQADGDRVARAGHLGAWSEAAQAEWIERYLPMLLAKQSVAGIFWSSYRDAADDLFPHTGLVRSDGSAKPALEAILAQRQAYQRGREGDA
jgi:hypothetical protein